MSMIHGRTSGNHGLLAAAWLLAGVLVTGSFATGQLMPLRATILVLATLSVIGITTQRITEMSLLSRLYVLLYVLPLGANLGYLFDLSFIWWKTPTCILLCQNHRLINEMLTVVLTGLCGLMGGIEFTAIFLGKQPSVAAVRVAPKLLDRPTLPQPVTLFLLAASVLFSWLHAPKETIFVAAYASAEAGQGMAGESGLNASYLISYLILILLFVDIERERPGSQRKWFKLMTTVAVLSYIVVVLQLLRGDRECAGMLAAIIMFYITSPASDATRARIKFGLMQMKRVMRVLVPVTGVFLAFLALGTLRHSASQTSSEKVSVLEAITDAMTENTWTAVALNNLGAAADFNYGTIEFLYGQTYVDYLLSLPPGVITLAMGYERPMEGDANPASWYFGRITCGGMHPAVVPFKNFGIWGVLPILFLCGAFICYFEARNELGTLFARMMYGCVATSGMLWFWYGDMNMIRTLMIGAILLAMYQVAAIAPQRGPARFPAQLRTQPQSRKPVRQMA